MKYVFMTHIRRTFFSLVSAWLLFMHTDCSWLAGNLKEQKGMVLPFQPLSMCFRNINYYVDVPEVCQRWIICMTEVTQKRKDMYLFIHNPVLLAGIKKARHSRRPTTAACWCHWSIQARNTDSTCWSQWSWQNYPHGCFSWPEDWRSHRGKHYYIWVS